MLYRNDTEAALIACENERTGHFGLDEGKFYEKEEGNDCLIPDYNEKTDSK